MEQSERAGGNRSSAWIGLGVFLASVFVSAFLIFQVQPLIGKSILPWFGGTAAVWTTCLLVFQVLLFAGYAYAHLSARTLSLRAQVVLHLLLLVAAATVPIVPAEAWKPAGDENPLLRIVGMLLMTVGLPYFTLSATGPLLQSWFWRAYPNRSPYPLYALSNAGSLLALISFPFVVEPWLSGPEQASAWRWGFVGLVALCAFCTARAWNVRTPQALPVHDDTDTLAAETRTTFGPRALVGMWISWAACGVILFMAVTNQMSLNVASVPFLWVLPLSIYLLSFIVAFGSERRYPRGLLVVLAVGAMAILYLLLRTEVRFGRDSFWQFSMTQQVVLYAAALFALCLVCHTELYRLRPRPSKLTSFYLSISFGGALGGGIVAVIAPMAFLLYQELHLGMLTCGLLLLVGRIRDRESRLFGGRPRWAVGVALLAVLGLAGLLGQQTWSLLRGTQEMHRNFFGLLRVQEFGSEDPGQHVLKLFDGAVLHGVQFVHPQLRRVPTAYYTSYTGIGTLLDVVERPAGRKIGVVGLGVGTIAAYGRPDDELRFYEINPNVAMLARDAFTYLRDCPCEWSIALGDARLTLEREENQEFDLLILDAFSSDSVPVHLLTVEVFETYARHVRQGGAIALHLSNLHLDLSPIAYQLAEQNGFHALRVQNAAGLDPLTMASTWMVLSRDTEVLARVEERFLPIVAAGGAALADRAPEGQKDVSVWTDDYSNLFQILR